MAEFENRNSIKILLTSLHYFIEFIHFQFSTAFAFCNLLVYSAFIEQTLYLGFHFYRRMISKPTLFRDDGSFYTAAFLDWLGESWSIPLVAVSIYMVLLYFGTNWMKIRPAYKLKLPLAAWNTFLAVFSLAGVMVLLPNFLHVISTYGVQESTCKLTILEDDRIGMWFMLFVFSKFVELGDTVFIILRKSQLQFLHWYHHVTVLVYSWFALAAGMYAAGYWFACINYSVHVVMYSYFAVRAFGIRTPPQLAVCITVLQILQMAMGLYVNYVLYKFNVEGRDDCFFDLTWFIFTCCLYGSYFILFVQFFCKKYLFKKPGSAVKNKDQ